MRRSIGGVALPLFAMLVLARPATADTVTQWIDRSVSGPSPRSEFGFAYDTVNALTTLFGGSSDLTFTAVNDETWTWDGTARALEDSTGPTPRCDNAMAYDTVRERIVSFAGYDGAFFSDTWIRDASGWQMLSVVGPTPRADAFMAFDTARGVMVLFGGLAPSGMIRRDTWEFGDSTWTQRATGGPPPARWIHRMAYDSARGVTVMFGGAAAAGLLADTWEWDGTAWTEDSIPGPSARYGHAMVYDVLNGVTVLFGGQSGFSFGQGVLGDTWVYDGTAWTELAISGPSARSFVKMVYDAARQRIVLFAGYDGTAMTSDTWELVIDAATAVSSGGPEERGGGRAARWVFVGNTPNPFRGQTEIRYVLPEAGPVDVTVLDASGALVRRLVDRALPAGPHEIVWDGKDESGSPVASGRYFLRVRAGEFAQSRTLVLLK